MIHNETYLLPKSVGARLGDRELKALISDLIKEKRVVKPYAVVTGRQLQLPFSTYSGLGNVLVGGKRSPAGIDLAYRGADSAALMSALSKRGEGDLIAHFDDLPPLLQGIPDRKYGVLLFALAAPREIELHQQCFDENFREIEGSGLTRFRVCTGGIVLCTDVDGDKHHPVRDLATVLTRHLGEVEQQTDMLF